jgi:hypothetical protein
MENDCLWKLGIIDSANGHRVGKGLKVVSIIPGNSYFVETLEGKELAKALSEKYLEKILS